MKHFKALASVLLTAALLCGCGNSDSSGGAAAISAADPSAAEPVSGTVTTVTAGSGSEADPLPDGSDPDRTEPTTLRPREATDKLTEGHTVKDYRVTAKFTAVTGENPYRSTTYEGVITDENELDKIWKMLCAAEAETPIKFAGFFGSGRAAITLTPEWGGQEVVISKCIGYYNEGEEGGPEVLLFTGLTDRDGTVWSMSHTADYDSNWLDCFCMNTIIARGEITGETIEDSDPVIENSNVAVVTRYTNWAWNVYDKVNFIDINGNVYSMTLADGEDYSYKPLTVKELLPKFEEMIADQNTKPSGKVSAEEIGKIKSLGQEISPDAKNTEDRSVMCDAGQNTLYVITDRVIELATTGDNEHELDDENARKAVKIYDEILRNIERTETAP